MLILDLLVLVCTQNFFLQQAILWKWLFLRKNFAAEAVYGQKDAAWWQVQKTHCILRTSSALY